MCGPRLKRLISWGNDDCISVNVVLMEFLFAARVR